MISISSQRRYSAPKSCGNRLREGSSATSRSTCWPFDTWISSTIRSTTSSTSSSTTRPQLPDALGGLQGGCAGRHEQDPRAGRVRGRSFGVALFGGKELIVLPHTTSKAGLRTIIPLLGSWTCASGGTSSRPVSGPSQRPSRLSAPEIADIPGHERVAAAAALARWCPHNGWVQGESIAF